LSHTTTSLEQPITLRVEVKGDNETYPDLSVLTKDFEILDRSQQQSVTVINGQVSKTRGLSLTLLPKNLGSLTIPAIPVGNEQSAPLALEVTAVETAIATSAEAEAFIQLETSKTKAYLQEEIILSVRLYLTPGLRGESLSDPEASLENTQIRFLNEEQYQAEHAGQTYHVVERRYSLYAYQTGLLQVGGISFRGRLATPPGQSFFRMLPDSFDSRGQQPRIISARSEQVQTEILPMPANYRGDHWLPARNLQVVESGLKSAGPLTAGRPATRHIVLIADGLPAAQLPRIELALPAGVKQYHERPHNRDNVLRDGISGSRHSAITLIAAEPGQYELPAIEIPWWNTETDRQETARLPAVMLQVRAGLPGSTAPMATQPFAKPFDDAELPFAGLEEQPEAAEAQDPPLVNWLVWLLMSAWLVTLVGWWRTQQHKKSAKPKTSPVTATENKPTPKDEFAEILSGMEAAYHAKNRESARAVWLKWGAYRWPAHPPSNLNRLAERCSQHIALAVHALDNAFYSPENRDDWVKFSPRELLVTESRDLPSSATDAQRVVSVKP
jgi:hypothetical protein